MENFEEDDNFYFDYQKFTKASLTLSQINLLLNRIINFNIPKIPIPYVGPYFELAMLLTQIAGIIKLISMRRDNVGMELIVAKQIHAQDLRLRHDNDVAD